LICVHNREGCDQLPVVTSSGDILGMVTLGNLMAKVVSGKAEPSDPATDLLYEQFTKIQLWTTLSELSRILEKNHFAIVVQKQTSYSGTDASVEKQTIVGVVTGIDLLNYISQHNKEADK
jgi:cystathionine beta-synthase